MKTLLEYISSDDKNLTKLAEIDINFELEVTINKSVHASMRQTRHGITDDLIISDEDIISTVKNASDEIMKDIVSNNINMFNRFVLRDKKSFLNLVCDLKPGSAKDKINIDVITVIRAEKFWNTKRNWVVTINK